MTREPSDTDDFALRRVLRDLREGPPAPALSRQRLSSALRLAPVNAPFAPRPPAATPRSSWSPRLVSRAASAWTLGGAGAVALLGAWLALVGRGAAPGAPLSPAVSPSSGVALRVNEGSTREHPSAAQPIRAAEKALPAAAASVAAPLLETKTERRPARDMSLAAERRLLDAARVALVAGDNAAGMDRLTSHARQFPRGALAEEREALMVDALVAAGRHEDARRRANAFHARYPASLFAPSVAAALQAIP